MCTPRCQCSSARCKLSASFYFVVDEKSGFKFDIPDLRNNFDGKNHTNLLPKELDPQGNSYCKSQAGIIEEMVEDTMEMMEDTDELEDDVQTEVDKVLNELTTDVGKKLASAPKVSAEASISLPEPGEVELEAEDGDEVQEDLDEMQERLQALKS